MELNLSPQVADITVYEGEGGGYYGWTPAKSPAVAQAEVGAGKLVLRPRGFAVPNYSTTCKIGYVAQGTCTVGLVSPDSPQEKVLIINEGDAIPVPVGTISWWFNGGDSDLIMIFLGESKQGYSPGHVLRILNGFSIDFISKIYHLDQADSKTLTKSQTDELVFKLGKDIDMPSRSNCKKDEYVFNLDNLISSNVKKLQGSTPSVASAEATAHNFPLLDKNGLSARLVRLEPNSVLNPSYSMSYQIIYVIKGTGRVQIVGHNGIRVLDASVQKDQLFVVPKFFTAAHLAGEQGMELYCVSTSSRPVLGQLGVGNASAWKSLSSSVLQASLNVSPEFVKKFQAKD